MTRAEAKRLPAWAAPALVCIVALTLLLQGCAAKAPESKPLLVQYYYENVCDACDVESEFLDSFEEYTGISRNTPNIIIETYNVFDEPNKKVFNRTMNELGVDKSNRGLPLLQIGNKIIPSNEIQKTLKGNELASTLPDAGSTQAVNASVAVYFSVPGCLDCENAEADTIRKLPPSVQTGGTDSPVYIKSVSVDDDAGIALFRTYCQIYHVPQDRQRTPLVFIGGSFLQGTEAIRKLPELLKQGDGLKTRLLQAGETQVAQSLTGYGWAGVFLTGLLNGLNPCAISMLLMLLSLMAVKKEWILPAGLAFAAGKFLGFLVLGTILYSSIGALHYTAVNVIIKTVLAVFAAIMIAMNVNDFHAAKNSDYSKIRLQLPVSLRKWNHGLIKRVSAIDSPVALVSAGAFLGLLIAVGEFLCTGQIYIAVILQVANSNDLLAGQAFGYLAVYSLAFVLPICALVLIVGKGRQVFAASEFFRKNMMWVKLTNALVFTVFFLLVFI